MARPRKPLEDRRIQQSVHFDPEVLSILEGFKREYPTRNYSDFVNAGVRFLKKQSGSLGLNANCEPVDPVPIYQLIEKEVHAIASEVFPKYAKEGAREEPPPKDRRGA